MSETALTGCARSRGRTISPWQTVTLLRNGYDKPALNAPEQQQQSALTMAEEDDARIRIVQSLRGKICKSDRHADVSHTGREVSRIAER